MQRLAERAVAGGLAPRHIQESGALFSVQVEPVPGGVGEAHFTHSQQSARKLLSAKAEICPLPCRFGALAGGRLNSITNSVKLLNQPNCGLSRTVQQNALTPEPNFRLSVIAPKSVFEPLA